MSQDAITITEQSQAFPDHLIADLSGLARDGNGAALAPVRPGEAGTVQTVPLTFSGAHLLVCAELESVEDLSVELIDDSGGVLPGYEQQANLVTRSHDGWYDVHWSTDRLAGRALIMHNADQPAALRFRLVRGRLHAFRIVDTWPVPARTSSDEAPIELSHHPQLFLDDHLVARMLNLQRQMKQPVKHPDNPLISAEHPWEQFYMQGTSVAYDPEAGRYKAWYCARPSRESTDPKFCDCYAESPDGITWTKPMIGRAPVGPWETHNALDGVKLARSVFRDPDDPDLDRRFKGTLGSSSPDGITWTASEQSRSNWLEAVGKNDTMTSFVHWKGEYLNYTRYQGHETNAIVHDPRTGKTWQDGVYRATGLATSPDFLHWTPKREIFRADERDGYPWAQPHALCVTAYGDVLIGLLAMMTMAVETGNNFVCNHEVQLMVSRDGRDWQRVADRAAFMPRHPDAPIGARAWDHTLHPLANFVVKDDQVRIYYKGMTHVFGEYRKNNVGIGALATRRHYDKPSIYRDLGLATLPADRFVALHPASYTLEGALDTKLLSLPPGDLIVNADLAHGRMEVELLDADENVLAGFDRTRSQLSPRDRLRFDVAWPQDDGTVRTLRDVPKDSPVALRFVLVNGDFYAFQIAGLAV